MTILVEILSAIIFGFDTIIPMRFFLGFSSARSFKTTTGILIDNFYGKFFGNYFRKRLLFKILTAYLLEIVL